MAQYTYNGISRKLGSFEGLGKSRLGDQASGTLGFTMPDFTGGALPGGCPDGSAPSDLRDQCDFNNNCYDSKGCLIPKSKVQEHYGIKKEFWQTVASCGRHCDTYHQTGDKIGYDACCKKYYGKEPKQEDSGPSAGEVLTGVGTILGSIANPLANIFATTQRARLERERLKRGGGARPGADPNAALYAALAQRRQGGGGNTTVIILAVVMLVVIIGAVLLLK